MNALKKITVPLFLSTAFLALTAPHAHAQIILPSFLEDLLSTKDPATMLATYIQTALVLAFGAIIVAALWYVGTAAYTMIKSKGEKGDFESGTKSVRAIMIGIATLFLGMIGVAVVLIFFKASFRSLIPQPACINAPNSIGCYACNNSDASDANLKICNKCSRESEDSLANYSLTAREGDYKVCITNSDGICTGERKSPYPLNSNHKCKTQMKEVVD